MELFSEFFNIWLKFFFLLTPFFSMSMFISLSNEMTEQEKYRIVYRTTFAIVILCFSLFFFGNAIFSIFGITLDSFRIGAGSLLFLSSVKMVQSENMPQLSDLKKDFSVVPLAIPITIGPATTGALLIMGAEITDTWHKIIGCVALLFASLSVGVLLLLSTTVKKLIGQNGLTIMEKLTGLILAALASQIIFTGIVNFLS